MVKFFLRVLRYLLKRFSPPRSLQTVPPPANIIPKELLSAYTLNSSIPVLYYYFDDTIHSGDNFCNTKIKYIRTFRKLKNRTFKYYGDNIQSFYKAFEKYSFKDKTVLIWGLAGCNCEAMAVWQGASRVFVVDYNPLVCEPEKITVLSHQQLIEQNIQTDIAISYSSFEHDGLGRYGDSLNPDADLEAMQKARKHLKDDGCLFFGVPEGLDCVVWNAHRIYGEKRLPLLLNGWEIADTFLPNKITDHRNLNLPLGKYVQPLRVLRKV
jgi:hypothetical protein